MSKFFSSKSYSILPQSESTYPAPKAEKDRNVSSHKILSFWVTLTVLFATLSVLLGVQLYWPRREGSFEKGYHYELGKFRTPLDFISRVLV